MEFTRYSTELAKYDPTTRFSFNQSNPEPEELIFEENLINETPVIAVQKTNIFIDKRNYAVWKKK